LVFLQQVLTFGNGAVLQTIGIIVLIYTLVAISKQSRASVKQANAADKLTEATERQMGTSVEQAKAAREQVDVARRQVTEAVRPILLISDWSAPRSDRGTDLTLGLENEGQGVALDVWWTYGEAKGIPSQRNYVKNGIIAPGKNRSFQVRDSVVVSDGLLIVYESLAGVVSGTRITWTGNEYHTDYYSDITEWARTLLGKPN
jgi:hypothetical protein